MSARPFVSVKFSPAGRTVSFLLPDIVVDEEPAAGFPLLADGFPLAASGGQLPASTFPTSNLQPPISASRPPSPDARPLIPGDRVIVETADGQAVGTVTRVPPALAERRAPASDSTQVVVRRASQEDVVLRLKQQQREIEAQRVAQLKIRERGLPMKLTRVEHLFDGSRLVFYYTAESRVDFRELVRDLAAHFRMRIEMRQIGVRDEAKMLGGYGSCGRPLCCTTWLKSFEPVSIKMAKQQQLSLNPSKLSGQCGRLKCCLRYELPNGAGVKHGGCADNGGCSNPTGCGHGNCGSCSTCHA
jgi:cell fate regulator YaaT (PSP1 superfamily)